MDESKIILCRCENITLADLHRALDAGLTSMQEIKRTLRCAGWLDEVRSPRAVAAGRGP